MGCGGSKEILEGCEKPLCHRMEKLDIESIDSCFERCSTIIMQVEEKRKFLADELCDQYYHTGAYVYATPDPQKALECAIWRLGVDNKGKAVDIGFNVETMCFEGKSNSEKGNSVANCFIDYMKRLATDWKMEDMNAISDNLSELVNEITSNMENYAGDIKEKFSSNPMGIMKGLSQMKTNLTKSTHALNCTKELCTRLKELCESAPAMMKNCTPDKIAGQQAHIDKAVKGKQTENLPIAFCVVEDKLRRAKTCKAVDEEYCAKQKFRTECLAKINA